MFIKDIVKLQGLNQYKNEHLRITLDGSHEVDLFALNQLVDNLGVVLHDKNSFFITIIEHLNNNKRGDNLVITLNTQKKGDSFYYHSNILFQYEMRNEDFPSEKIQAHKIKLKFKNEIEEKQKKIEKIEKEHQSRLEQLQTMIGYREKEHKALSASIPLKEDYIKRLDKQKTNIKSSIKRWKEKETGRKRP